jgi:hypothetical protein
MTRRNAAHLACPSPLAHFKERGLAFFSTQPEWDELLLLGIFHDVTTNSSLLEAGRACVLVPWTPIHELLASIALQTFFRRWTNCTLAGAEKNERQWIECSKGVSQIS